MLEFEMKRVYFHPWSMFLEYPSSCWGRGRLTRVGAMRAETYLVVLNCISSAWIRT